MERVRSKEGDEKCKRFTYIRFLTFSPFDCGLSLDLIKMDSIYNLGDLGAKNNKPNEYTSPAQSNGICGVIIRKQSLQSVLCLSVLPNISRKILQWSGRIKSCLPNQYHRWCLHESAVYICTVHVTVLILADCTSLRFPPLSRVVYKIFALTYSKKNIVCSAQLFLVCGPMPEDS